MNKKIISSQKRPKGKCHLFWRDTQFLQNEEKINQDPKPPHQKGGNIRNILKLSEMRGSRHRSSRTLNFSSPSTPVNISPHQPEFQRSNDIPPEGNTQKQLRNLTSAMGQIQSQLVKVLSALDDVKGMFSANSLLPADHGPLIDFHDHYCDTQEKLEIFEEKLHFEFRNIICHGIKTKIDLKSKLQYSIGRILRALMPTSVLDQYTAQKKKGEKKNY
ncbi:uncharacterized protein [Fopius arisanus]|uniref:Uncharacterized protein isoform X1 n=1 Tax=Fopius arisanus TaxID=64838 RepID=A0A9R1TZZ1_9HYME|nr:PREDICTED: uncharacterized protein LOC105265993 isoform X1 [Fopius arisanus]